MRISRCLSALLVFLPLAFGQEMYVYSDLAVDESSGDVTVTASTSTDYNSAYYYDMGVSVSLHVQPLNAGSYQACDQSRGTTTDSYVSASCSYNLGSESADLTGESYHYLDVCYYYYQLEPYCTWECNQYDDYYGFSLVSTIPSYDDNQWFYAPGQSTPIQHKTSLQAYIYRTKHRGACLYPTSETTYPWGWNFYWPYVGQFLQLLGGGTFDSRFVTEVFSGSASDQCWRPANGGQPVGNPSPGTWYVSFIKGMDASGFAAYQFTYSNGWGLDHLGFWGSSGSTTLYNYVQNMRPTSSACSVTFNQNMYMFCSSYSGPGQYYSSGPLSLIIAATPTAASLTSSRNGISQARNYP